MTYSIVPSSPVARELAESPKRGRFESVYPFDQLNVGMSFTIPLADANVESLRSLVSRKSKEGKKFILVKHDEMNPPVVEVARVS